MNLTSRSLPLTMFLYFAALGVAAAAAYAGGSVLAPAVQGYFLKSHERPQTRLDVVSASAREIREALAKPVGKVEPLPPITARPQHTVTAVTAKAERKAPAVTLSAEARNAFAWSEPPRSDGGVRATAFDRHRPE